MAAFAFSTIRSNVVSQVETQLSGVTVNDFPQPAETDIDVNETDDTLEWVQFGLFRANRDEATYDSAAGKRFDSYDLNGEIGVHHTNAFGTAPDAAWKVVEDRAETLLNGVAAGIESDPTLGGNVFHAEIAEVDEQGGGDANRYSAGFSFVVRIQSFAT